jgi:hypothetical protein
VGCWADDLGLGRERRTNKSQLGTTKSGGTTTTKPLSWDKFAKQVLLWEGQQALVPPWSGTAGWYRVVPFGTTEVAFGTDWYYRVDVGRMTLDWDVND